MNQAELHALSRDHADIPEEDESGDGGGGGDDDDDDEAATPTAARPPLSAQPEVSVYCVRVLSFI